MTAYLGLSSGTGEGGGSTACILPHNIFTTNNRDDSKASLNILMRLQRWVTSEFHNLNTSFLNDSNSEQFLRISRSSPHPVLVTLPSVQLVCRVDRDMILTCHLLAFNSIVIKEIVASLDEEYEDLKVLLTKLNNHQSSICKGIPEEKLVTWAIRKNLSQILIERFLTRVVFRERNCSYVMFESDQADICRSCALLLSSSSMDLNSDQELECPDPDCTRTFRYQGALDKHIQKHKECSFDEVYVDEKAPYEVKEESGEGDEKGGSMNHIKMEPEVNVKEAKTEQSVDDPEMQQQQQIQQQEGGGDEGGDLDDGQFIDRLLDDIDQDTYPSYRKKRKTKVKKPTIKDFSCSDCGKAFYYQKNLFTHVVEAHGKSVDELPNLALVKSEDGRKRKKRKKGRGGKSEAYCDECGVSFKFASGLYNHRKRMHGDTEKVQCKHCHKMVKSCTLDQHIREEHGTPRYACQFCGKGFYYKSFMLNHQRLHTGDYKECVCDLCGAVYKSVQVLNRHVRNAHQDLRNFKCTHCDKAFHNKQRLDRHINSQHTKSKLWPCPACHSKYDRKDNLRTHIRKNHAGVLNPDTVNLVPIENDSAVAAPGGTGGLDQVSSNPKKSRNANTTAAATNNPLLAQTFFVMDRVSSSSNTSTDRINNFAAISERSQSIEEGAGPGTLARTEYLDPETGYANQDLIKREENVVPSHILARHETDLLRLAAVQHQQQQRSNSIHQQQQQQHHQQLQQQLQEQQDRFSLVHSPPSSVNQVRDIMSAAVRAGDFATTAAAATVVGGGASVHTPPPPSAAIASAAGGPPSVAVVHSLTQSLHNSASAVTPNPYATFHGLQGHPQI